MNKNIFRKVALDRLSSPEQLDTIIKVTNPKGWLGLIGLAVLLILFISWGFFGSLTTQLHGQGVLISSGGMQMVYTSSTGQISDVSVSAGDLVQAGDVIARMDASQEVTALRQVTEEIQSLEDRLLQKIVDVEEEQAILEQLDQLNIARDRLVTQFLTASRIVTPYTGRVTQVLVQPWDYVTPGTATVMIEPEGANIVELIGIFYVPATEATRLNPGMEVKITPAGIDRETYGYIYGRVNQVGTYPATDTGMMQVLNNETLVQSLTGDQVMVEVRVDLIPEVTNESGYKWSVSEGPPFKINSGTISTGKIVIRQESPVQTILRN